MTAAAGARERGSIAPLVPIVLLAFLVLGGLVIDGARALNARGNAQAFAEEAARAGATAIDKTSPYLRLDPQLARQRYDAYCAALGTFHKELAVQCESQDFSITDLAACNAPTAQPLIVNTTVNEKVETTLLGILGISDFTETGTAQARPFQGLTGQSAC